MNKIYLKLYKAKQILVWKILDILEHLGFTRTLGMTEKVSRFLGDDLGNKKLEKRMLEKTLLLQKNTP